MKYVIELENEHECAAVLFAMMTTLMAHAHPESLMAVVLDRTGPRVINQLKAQGLVNDELIATAKRMELVGFGGGQ